MNPDETSLDNVKPPETSFQESKSLREMLKPAAHEDSEKEDTAQEEALLAAQEPSQPAPDLSLELSSGADTEQESEKEPENNLTKEQVKNIVRKHMLNKARVREYKREYSRRKRQELKEHIADLEARQIKGSSVQMIVFNDKIVNYSLNTEAEYVKLINDLLGTLQDNKIVLEYRVRNESILRE